MDNFYKLVDKIFKKLNDWSDWAWEEFNLFSYKFSHLLNLLIQGFSLSPGRFLILYFFLSIIVTFYGSLKYFDEFDYRNIILGECVFFIAVLDVLISLCPKITLKLNTIYFIESVIIKIVFIQQIGETNFIILILLLIICCWFYLNVIKNYRKIILYISTLTKPLIKPQAGPKK